MCNLIAAGIFIADNAVVWWGLICDEIWGVVSCLPSLPFYTFISFPLFRRFLPPKHADDMKCTDKYGSAISPRDKQLVIFDRPARKYCIF